MTGMNVRPAMRWSLAQFVLALSLLLAGATLAVAEVDAPLADPARETRARELMKEVRCVVCQAQSIAESDAGIAVDLRRLIREEIADGKSDDEIRQFLVARYGDFILFRPPFEMRTLVLWVGPFVVLAGGFIFIVRILRRRPGAAPAGALNQDEQRRVAQALSEDRGELS